MTIPLNEGLIKNLFKQQIFDYNIIFTVKKGKYYQKGPSIL